MSLKSASNTPNDIPEGRHWAIVVFGTITIPGDERSRTNPGHGYPESTESRSTYHPFDDEKEWRAEVERMVLAQRRDFVALVVERPRISTHVSVSFGGGPSR